MAKSPKKTKKRKQNPKRQTDQQVIRKLFPKEVLDDIRTELKDREPEREQ